MRKGCGHGLSLNYQIFSNRSSCHLGAFHVSVCLEVARHQDFCPSLRSRYHKQYKAQTLTDLERGKLDVVVTTFETCRDNVEELNRFKWAAIIADEVHKIKVFIFSCSSTLVFFLLVTF